MANTLKVLGQINPSAETPTTLYTVPSVTSAIISTINICNLSANGAQFRVAIRPAGESLATKHYIAYNTAVAANDSVALTMGITMATTDVITVYANTTTVSFSAFGSEIT
jgi:hypothetical protein